MNSILFIDRFAQQIGLALGFKQLGFNVNYWCENKYSENKLTVINHYFNRVFDIQNDEDLTVWVESFSDLEKEHGLSKSLDIYDFILNKKKIDQSIVIDSSDSNYLFDTCNIVGKTFFKRELKKEDIKSAWQSFPFLHSLSLLKLNLTFPNFSLNKEKKYNLSWSGSFGHGRVNLLNKVNSSNKNLTISQNLNFIDYLNFVSQSENTLYLKGGGWMCYRLHELLFCDTPMVYEKPDIKLHFDLNEIGVELNNYLNNNYEEKKYDIQSWYENFYSPEACAKYLLNNI